MKILIFATDVPPLSGLPSSGTALRTYGFKRGFEALGHETIVMVPKMAFHSVAARSDLSVETRQELLKLEPYIFDHTNIDDLVFALKPDLIYCGHWPAACYSKFPNCPVVIDLAGPHLLERHYQGSGDHYGGVRAKLSALSGGDFFIVSGKRQKEYFKSFLSRAGIDRIDERIIVAPMALPPEVPKRPEEVLKEIKFLFAGIFLPWQDPTIGLTALVEELAAKNQGSLRLIGGFHQTYPVPGGVYKALFNSIEKNSRVTRSDLVSIDVLNQEMLKADVALDLMAWNLERELAVTIRTTTYLWSGLPVIYNNYSDLSDLIFEYEAGWLIDPADAESLKKLVAFLLANPEEVRRRSLNASRLAESEFSWERHAKSILSAINTTHMKRNFSDLIFDSKQSADYFLEPEGETSQEFVSRQDGLSKVQTRLAAHNSSGQVELLLYQLDGSDSKLVSSQTIDVDEANEHFWTGLNFDPVPDSKGKKYRLQFRSKDPRIALWTANKRKYPLLDFTYRGAIQKDLSICLRTVCSKSLAAQ